MIITTTTLNAEQFNGQQIAGTTYQYLGLLPDGSPDAQLMLRGEGFRFTVKRGDWVLTYSDGSLGYMSSAQFAADFSAA